MWAQGANVRPIRQRHLTARCVGLRYINVDQRRRAEEMTDYTYYKAEQDQKKLWSFLFGGACWACHAPNLYYTTVLALLSIGNLHKDLTKQILKFCAIYLLHFVGGCDIIIM